MRLTPEFQVGSYNPEKRRVGTLPLTATPAERAEHRLSLGELPLGG